MSLFGKDKKHKKHQNKEYSGKRKYFSGMDDYEDEYDEYDEDEYEDEESDDEYYEDEESDEYDGEEYYEDEYYEEEPEDYVREEYYESEEPEDYVRDEYYEGRDADDSEYYEEEYYGDDVNYYGEGDEEEESYDEEDEDLYYVDEGEYEDYDDDEEDDDFIAYRKKKGVAGAVLAFRNLPLIDKVIAFTGVAVLVFAVLTGTIFIAARNEDKAVAAFAEVGTSLDGIKIIGESGLLAVADAQLAKETAAEVEEEETQIVEEEPVKGANVALKMTSIVKDLKIKFVNTASDKLIANVPFQVEITTPSKKTETWTDDDRDGVIYKENIEAGTYKVKMVELTGEGYSDYKISTEVQSVEVKANIDYKKVDVKEEIKTEAEVNAAVEDTAIAEVVEESKLTDTVPFVKSTQTGGGQVSYTKIDKNTIREPGATASIETAGYYLMMSDNDPPAPVEEKKLTIDGSISVKAGESKKIGVQSSNIEKIEWESADPGVATVSSDGTVTGVKAGKTTVTASAEGVSTVSCTVTVEEVKVAATLTISPASLALSVGANGTITATSNQNTVTWASSDANVASVTWSADTKTATVKALKAGTTTITATAADADPQKCTVTVTDTGVSVDKTSVQVQIKKTADIKVTTVPDSAKIKEVVSGKKEIATAAFKDKTVTVTGVALGDTEVVIKCDNGKEVKVAVKVVNNFELDTTSLLKDKNGNQVFVSENGKYRKAVYADYYKFNEFYLETQEILYTGWQNINGKTYYYLENHQYITGEQVIQGAKYTFASDGSLVTSSGTFGIDVSKWNGNIDWNSVKSSGAAYAIIRCGYRGSSTGALITDPKFAANISGANAAGLKVGVYFFTQAVNEKEAVEEASMVLDLVKKYKISYPIFLDVEGSGGRADGIDKGTRTAVCKAFCATIQNSGYTAGVYANKTWLNSKIDAGALGSYKIWLAQYAAAPSYSGRYNLWQYSSKGSVPGIKGNVDMNQSYLGY